ncbi:MAG: glycosyltransferase [Lachnospiraceae bacterium]|nr:glycosyltransferase [Lachnospiraceae bacterium]
MKLSVIVPVYNMAEGGKLEFCIDSLLAQTLDPEEYEIIAVDDHSTDDSLKILKKYESDRPGHFFAVASDRNRHQGGAKNRGLAMARGEWIGFIDADDWVTPDYYERLLSAAESAGADMAGCDYCFTKEHGFEPGERIPNNRPEQAGVLDDEKKRLLLLEPGSLVVKIYRRELILGLYKPGSSERVDIFPEDIFYEDNAVAGSWMLRATCFAYIPEALYFYYQHDTSTVHSVNMKNLEDRKKSAYLMLGAAREEGWYGDYTPELEYRFSVLFYKNTLFSALQAKPHPAGVYGFTKALARRMRDVFPDFQDNPYYVEKVHPEEKKLIGMQQRSQLLFYLYYRLLWFYRDVIRGKKKASDS